MTKQRDIAASVRQRLLNLAREQGEDFQALLTRFTLERFLYRLSQSEHSDQFILKGALLFSLWSDDPHRATWDIDLLGHGPSTLDRLQAVFRQVCQVRFDADGLTYLSDSVTCFRIKEAQQYESVRVQLRAQLGKARMRVQVDVGFGDAVVPPPRTVDFPSLLELPTARLRAYPPETVVAEKFQAMVLLAMANSRMKDFYDVWRMTQTFALEGPRLSRAIKATFKRRQTPLPTEAPLALTSVFYEETAKQAQWRAFVRKAQLNDQQASLAEVITILESFLMPLTLALVDSQPFEKTWPPGGPWRPK